jgi:hypothetical protein
MMPHPPGTFIASAVTRRYRYLRRGSSPLPNFLGSDRAGPESGGQLRDAQSAGRSRASSYHKIQNKRITSDMKPHFHPGILLLLAVLVLCAGCQQVEVLCDTSRSTLQPRRGGFYGGKFQSSVTPIRREFAPATSSARTSVCGWESAVSLGSRMRFPRSGKTTGPRLLLRRDSR